MNLDNYRVEDATHTLDCCHCIGSNHKHYIMLCTLLPSKSKKAKVVVFGHRNWKDTGHIKRVRYVDRWRLKKIKQVTMNDRINRKPTGSTF